MDIGCGEDDEVSVDESTTYVPTVVYTLYARLKKGFVQLHEHFKSQGVVDKKEVGRARQDAPKLVNMSEFKFTTYIHILCQLCRSTMIACEPRQFSAPLTDTRLTPSCTLSTPQAS